MPVVVAIPKPGVDTGDKGDSQAEELLNPADMLPVEEAEHGDSGVGLCITCAKVNAENEELLCGKIPGMDQVHLKYLKCLDAVGLSWLTISAMLGGSQGQNLWIGRLGRWFLFLRWNKVGVITTGKAHSPYTHGFEQPKPQTQVFPR